MVQDGGSLGYWNSYSVKIRWENYLLYFIYFLECKYFQKVYTKCEPVFHSTPNSKKHGTFTLKISDKYAKYKIS
jgi:hypothetical protein